MQKALVKLFVVFSLAFPSLGIGQDQPTALRDMASQAIQVILNPEAGLALVPEGTILPQGLRITATSRRFSRTAKNEQTTIGESPLRLSDLPPAERRQPLVFQYADRARFAAYQSQFNSAIAAAYANRAASEGKARIRPADSGSGYPTVITYLDHSAVHVADIYFQTVGGTQYTVVQSSVSGVGECDYVYVDASTNNDSSLDASNYCSLCSSLNVFPGRPSLTNSYPYPRSSVYCSTDFGRDGGGNGGSGWEVYFEVDYLLYD